MLSIIQFGALLPVMGISKRIRDLNFTINRAEEQARTSNKHLKMPYLIMVNVTHKITLNVLEIVVKYGVICQTLTEHICIIRCDKIV